MKRAIRFATLLFVLPFLAAGAAFWTGPAHAVEPPVPLASGLSPQDIENRPWRDYVRECLDLLLAHGTDRYGPASSPMLVSILDVRTRECPAEPLPLDEAVRVIRRGRRNPAGGNLYTDQATYRALYALSDVLGDPRYRDFADRSLAHYLAERVDEKGLWWWGWHRYVDAYRDVLTGHMGNVHEIHVQEAAWPVFWSVNPASVTREIEALWQWHVWDKATGEVNRHADGQRGCDFAMTGGEILQAFAFLHRRTGDPAWLDRARCIADYYWNARDRRTDLIPNRPNAGRDRFDGYHFDTSIPAYHCRGLLRAHELTGDARFRDYAVAYLKAYARYGYDEKTGRFWGSLTLDGRPVPGPRVVGGFAQYEPRGHLDPWQPYAAGYEYAVPAAQVYVAAAERTGDPDLLQAARRWADFLRGALPPRACEADSWYGDYARTWAPLGTYAEHYGRTISFFLHLHALTGEADALDTARAVAREAVAKLYYRGLLRGHPGKPYYEAMDGVGYLLYALLQLDRTVVGQGEALPRENW